jgi:trans-2,3-dihydro-3-hydroxyanthranilate isomerase
MKLDYLVLDVFTRVRLSGNPLAVVLRADGLLDDQMQRIAAEFNLSETVFVTRPRAERHAAALRIFTPRVELPFAGHPTIGAAVAIGLDGKASVLRLEEQVGVVTAVIERVDRRAGHARFALPQLPEMAGKPPDRLRAALALGIEPEAIGCGRHRLSVYSAGSLFYLVPVRDSLVLRRLQPNAAAWAEAFPLGRHNVYIYTPTPEAADADFAARKFALGLGLEEDPATGAAAAALIGELAADAGDGLTEYRLRQGVEMGRPSLIELQLRKDGEVLTHGSIGGHAVVVGQGTLDLGD